MNLITPHESPYRAARRAYSLVQNVKQQANRLKAADESTLAHAPDRYAGEVGRVKAVFGLGQEGYAKFDLETGEIEKATMAGSQAHVPSLFTLKSSIRSSSEQILYSMSDTSGFTSSTVSVDKRSGRYTLKDKIFGITIREYAFGALGDGPWSPSAWKNNQWPQRGPCDDLQVCPPEAAPPRSSAI
jgi:hypothetical protein